MAHSLLVPMDGAVELVTEPYDGGPTALLSARGAVGPVVQLALNPDNDGRHLWFRLAEVPPQNNRARQMLARLTGVHFEITGPAVFTGLTDEDVATMMEQT